MSSPDVLARPPSLGLLLQPRFLACWRQWDDLVSTAVTHGLQAVGFSDIQKPSPVTAHRFFTRSPTPLVTVMAAYLIVVLVGLAVRKPRASKKEDPWLLRVFLQAHNLFLISLSAYMFGGTVYQAVKNRYSFWGTGYKDSEVGMANVIYVFYVSKIYEYMDTVSNSSLNLHRLTYKVQPHKWSGFMAFSGALHSLQGGNSLLR